MSDRDRATRLYVIGDIHGRLDLLNKIVNGITQDLDKTPVRHALTVTLGDYIDRGPHSRAVLDRLALNPFPTEYLALKGNHEEFWRSFYEIRQPATIGG